MNDHDAQTDLIRSGLERTAFDETSPAMFLTSGYVYPNAEAAEAAFAGDLDHYIYSRYGNPTVDAFAERLRTYEGAEACWATASGMSAVFTALIASLDQGDHVVAAQGLFGSCFVILSEILPRWGITTEFVDGADLEAWEKALETPTQVVFFETPSNPMQDLIDVAAVSELAHAVGARVIVDNVFATPVFQKPLTLGADVVVYSTTKQIDGQGRTLGGAILSSREFADDNLKPLMRHTGPAMSPFTAWTLLGALETLELRVHQQAKSAAAVTHFLHDRPNVDWVRYPFDSQHPQHELATRQMTGGGTVVTFGISGGKAAAFAFMNALQVFDISNNLGDSKSLVTHPATTTHRRLGPQVRADMGITDGTLRLSIGLESAHDLTRDLDRALSS